MLFLFKASILQTLSNVYINSVKKCRKPKQKRQSSKSILKRINNDFNAKAFHCITTLNRIFIFKLNKNEYDILDVCSNTTGTLYVSEEVI